MVHWVYMTISNKWYPSKSVKPAAKSMALRESGAVGEPENIICLMTRLQRFDVFAYVTWQTARQHTCLHDWKLCRRMTYSGMALRFGMWQYVWNTFGHLSQHTNSPPSMQTAHQSSLGSSFCVSPPCLVCSEKNYITWDVSFLQWQKQSIVIF